jgi:hypothetical protein
MSYIVSTSTVVPRRVSRHLMELVTRIGSR